MHSLSLPCGFIPDASVAMLSVGSRVRLFYKLDINTYLGESSLCLIIEHVNRWNLCQCHLGSGGLVGSGVCLKKTTVPCGHSRFQYETQSRQ